MLFSKQMEYSKKLAFFDTIVYIIFVIATILLTLFVPDFLGICPDLITIFTTGHTTLRLGYAAKAGIENYRKISSTMKTIQNDDSDYYYEDELG